MAQYAGRASVALNTHLFFKGRTQEEEGSVVQTCFKRILTTFSLI